MKNLNQRFPVIFIFLLLNSSFILSQTIDNGEFMFVNKSNHQIYLKIYPDGAIFNGNNEYNVYAIHQISSEQLYIYPKGPQALTIDPYGTGNYLKRANFDKDPDNFNCDFSLGYGSYIMEIEDGTNITYIHLGFSDAKFCTGIDGYKHKIRFDYSNTSPITYNFIDDDGITNFNTVQISNEGIINVWEQQGVYPPRSFTPDEGDFTDASNPLPALHNWPLIATSFYSQGHLNPEQYFLNLRISNANVTNINAEEKILMFAGINFKIDGGKTVNISGGNNPEPTMKVIGSGKLITGNQTTLNLPDNFILEISSHSSFDANGTTFQPLNSFWNQIYLSYPYDVFINNCIFKNSLTSVHFSQNNRLSTINECTFDNFANIGVSVEDSKNLLLTNNHFNAPIFSEPCTFNAAAIAMWHNSNSEEENNDNSNGINIYIINNDFHNGIFHIRLDPIGDNFVYAYIKDNIFDKGICNISMCQTIGPVIHNNASIKDLYENSFCLPVNVDMYSSAPNFLDNTFINRYNNIKLNLYSYPIFEPCVSQEGLFFWRAGLNKFSTEYPYEVTYANIRCADQARPGYFFTDYGKNEFSAKYWYDYSTHFWGYIDNLRPIYLTRGNCWYGENGQIVNPIIGLFLKNEQTVPYNWNNPNVDCHFSEQIVDRVITDLGNGIFDTVIVTQLNNFQDSTAEDIAIFSTGVRNQELKNYSTAIQNFKNIIDNHSNSKYFEKTIFNLYGCYVSCDSNRNQNWRNIIFGDLKNYLENKILQYDSNETFVSLAFDFFLKCSIKKKGYSLAMDGYQFIAENSPSSTERLMASINYIDVEGLLQGSGGGQSENFENELSSDRNGKPIKDIILALYNKTKKSTEKKEKAELDNSSDKIKTKSDFDRKHASDRILENRAKENINISSSLTKKDRRERIQKDLMLLHQRDKLTENVVRKNNIEPIKYELSQNYPNPFNPITNIKYQIQKTGIVTLRIYDITGREIKTLVNEIKNPGSYIITFNGSEFASGVYFYRIQAGDFVQVKKMVLIK